MQINVRIFAHLIKERALGTRVLFFLYVLHNLRTKRGWLLYHLSGGEFVLKEGIDIAWTLVVQACCVILQTLKCL